MTAAPAKLQIGIGDGPCGDPDCPGDHPRMILSITLSSERVKQLLSSPPGPGELVRTDAYLTLDEAIFIRAALNRALLELAARLVGVATLQPTKAKKDDAS